MTKFFVSYSRSIKSTLSPVIDLLRSAGHDVWWDADIPEIADWWATILSKIEWAEVCIFVVSEKSIQSPYCLAELKYATDRNRPILPFVIDDQTRYTIPPEVTPQRNQWFIYDGDPERTLKHLAEATARIDWSLYHEINLPRPPEPNQGGGTLAKQFQQAVSLAENGHFEEARKLFRNVASLDPREWAEECQQWQQRLAAYGEIADLADQESTIERARKQWNDYRATPLYKAYFDPLGVSTKLRHSTKSQRGPNPLYIVTSIVAVLAILIVSGLLVSQYANRIGTTSTDSNSGQTAIPTPADIVMGSVRTDGFGISQVYVPAGHFTMGSTDQQVQDAYIAAKKFDPGVNKADLLAESPAHDVTINNGFWLDQFLVTNAAYQNFVEAGGYKSNQFWSADGLKWRQTNNITGPETSCTKTSSQLDHPRVCLSYYEAEAYAIWRGGRLPTEAEWEFAARGPESRIYPWGDTFNNKLLNYCDKNCEQPWADQSASDGYPYTSPVSKYKDGISWVNAYDMAGNVWEWTSDWYNPNYYTNSPGTDPTGPTDGTFHVARGGSWYDYQVFVRTASRGYFDAGLRRMDLTTVGFRVVEPPGT